MSTSRALVRAWMALLASSALGCSALIEVETQQCEQASDCAELGFEAECVDQVCVIPGGLEQDVTASTERVECGDTVCLGLRDPVCFDGQCAARADVEPFMCEAQTLTPGTGVPFAAEIVEYTMPNRPLPGLSVTACGLTDVTCSDPVLSVSPEGGDNTFQVMLPWGFDGYLMIESDVTMPFIWHFASPLTAEAPPRTVFVLTYQTIDIVAEVAGVTVDLTKGIVIMQAHACDGAPQGGMHFGGSENLGTPFYLVNLLPNLDADVTIYDPDRNIAVGGFFNATPGFTLLTARVGVGGPLVVSQNAHIRMGAMTYLDIRG